MRATKNERKKGSGTPTDAYPTVRIISDAAACSAEHARLSAFHRGSSWRCRNISVQLQARLPGTRPPVQRQSLGGRYPPLPVPVQWHPRPATYYRRHDAQSRPGEVCETARGHRTRSVIRIASGLRPALSEIRKSNYNGDQCQWKSDVDLPVIPAVVAGIHVFIPKTWMAGTSPAMTLWSHPRSAARLTGPLNRPPISFSAAAARASLQPPCFTFSKNFCSISARVSGSCAPPRI